MTAPPVVLSLLCFVQHSYCSAVSRGKISVLLCSVQERAMHGSVVRSKSEGQVTSLM